jgi:hypothetical protein
MVAGRKTKSQSLDMLEKAYVGVLLIIFGGIVLHAPLSVGLGALWPDYSLLIKSWKEVLMGVAMILVAVSLWRKRQLSILKEPLMIGVSVYAVLHILSLTFLTKSSTLSSITAGLMIDLRYILFFALVYIALRLYPTCRRIFIRVGIVGALIVVTFALLQVFILPVDVLKYIGYNINSIVPYLTIDQNHDYIRINSTLRGPNPLGAYAVIVLAGITAWLTSKKANIRGSKALIIAVLLLGSVVSLWASYSRSALVVAVVAVLIVLSTTTLRKISRRSWIIGSVIVLALLGVLLVARGSEFVSNVLLHDSPTSGSLITSNDNHIDSLQDGFRRLLTQPLGAGVGSTGSASLFGDSPLIIENQYLFIAHEVGWLGLAVFILIVIGVFIRLWQRRADWLALAVFASGIGLVLMNLLLPVWVDDTISIVWWGLAAVSIGGRYRE